MISKYGYSYIISLLIISVLLWAGYFYFKNAVVFYIAIVTTTLLLFVLNFFRDPNRKIPAGENVVVSAADGKITAIDTVVPPEYITHKMLRVSIFLSVFDVHVNRIPIDGKIEFLKYIPGKFLAAFDKDASLLNEQMIVGMKSGKQRLMVVQIAGLIARRIICRLREGQPVQAGERFGIIKFGSRTDIYLPLSAQLKVKTGQRVKGGETIIGVLDEK